MIYEQVTIPSHEKLKNMKAYELLNSAQKLARRNYAIGLDGAFTNPRHGPTGHCNAVKWDICGALMHCYPDNNQFNDVFQRVQESTFVNEWVARFKKSLTDKDMIKTCREHNRTWTIFNDYATYEEITKMLIELDV